MDSMKLTTGQRKGYLVRSASNASVAREHPRFSLFESLPSKLGIIRDCDVIVPHEHAQHNYAFNFRKSTTGANEMVWLPISPGCCEVTKAHLLPMQDRVPIEKGAYAFLGQSPRNRSGLNSFGLDQYLANGRIRITGTEFKRPTHDWYAARGVMCELWTLWGLTRPPFHPFC
jgi:hypothetical protein